MALPTQLVEVMLPPRRPKGVAGLRHGLSSEPHVQSQTQHGAIINTKSVVLTELSRNFCRRPGNKLGDRDRTGPSGGRWHEKFRATPPLDPRVRDGGGGKQLRRVGMLGWVSTRLVSPCSTTCPCCITATRSATTPTTARSWVMNRQAKPISVCRRRSSASTRDCTDTSSELVGSSATTSCGRSANARAIATRWR
jgi:hypothetical protein